MKNYRIEISKSAEKQLRDIHRDDQKRILRAILKLANDPHPRGHRKLSGYDDIFRIRVGTYRVLYNVNDQTVIVIVLKIGHRKDVYR